MRPFLGRSLALPVSFPTKTLRKNRLTLTTGRMGLGNDLAENILLSLVRTGVENDFEEVVFPEYPSLREIKRLLMGIDSGGTCFVCGAFGIGFGSVWTLPVRGGC